MADFADSVFAGPLFWAGFGVCLPQALRVRRRATRLPPAAGPTRNRIGDGPMARLVGIGDSIIDGVGVATAPEALTGRVAACWAAEIAGTVEWTALGQNGIDAGGALRRLVPRLPEATVDCFLVSVGVNDVTHLKSTGRWRADLLALLDALRGHSPGATIVLLSVPPLECFPALPRPLSAVLGLRAATFNRIGRAVANRRAGFGPGRVRFVEYREFGPLTPDGFADDGYHPNAQACARFASLVAPRIGAPCAGSNEGR